MGMKLLAVAVLALPLIQGCGHEQQLQDIEDGFHADDAGLPVRTLPSEPACVGSQCPACAPGAPAQAAVDAGSRSPSFSSVALQLDGASEYVRLGDLTFPTGSISIWLQTSGNGFLFSKAQRDGSTPGELRLSINQCKLRYRIDAEGKVQQHFSDAALSDGRWHHVLVTFNPGMKMFVDGRAQADDEPNNVMGMTITGADAELGRNNAEGAGFYYYGGLLDEVAIFDRVLTAAEALSIYNGGTPGNLLGPGSSPAPQHWWRLGEDDVPPTAIDRAGSAHGTLVNIDASNFVSTGSPSSASPGCVTN